MVLLEEKERVAEGTAEHKERVLEERRERLYMMRCIGAGSTTKWIAGAGTITLSIIALAGVEPAVLVPVAFIGLGVAIFIEALSIGFAYRSQQIAHVSRTAAMELVVGAGAAVLGLLSLVYAVPGYLLPIAVLGIATSVLLGWKSNARLREFVPPRSREHGASRDAMTLGSAIEILAAILAIPLGIIALAGVVPLVLTAVAVLSLGFGAFVSGATLAYRMFSYDRA